MRFYFDFTDGDLTTRDLDGHDLDGFDAVQRELRLALPEVLLSDPRDVDERHLACSVRDEGGAVVCRASVTLTLRPSAEG